MVDLGVVQGQPFPHLVTDGFWEDDLLRAVVDEFPPVGYPGWRTYWNQQEAKLEGPPSLWGPNTQQLAEDITKLAPQLSEVFEIPDLSAESIGGGYHLIPSGGHLDVHTDFSASPETGLYRRLNFLIFLNEGWEDPGGHLELWDDESLAVDLAPEFNRTVVFATSSKSWHGHPQPAERERRSFALYFFSPEKPPGFQVQSTVWKEA